MGTMRAMANPTWPWRPSPELVARLEAASFVLGRSMNDLATEAVESMLDNHPRAKAIEKALAVVKDRSTPR